MISTAVRQNIHLKMDVMEEMDVVRDLIKENISYDALVADKHFWNIGQLDQLIEIMVEDTVVDVKDMRKYLLSTLYNAPNTIDSYYSMKVNYDMNQADWGKPLDEKSKSLETDGDEQ